MNIKWDKVCAYLAILLVGLAAWGLSKVYEVDVKTETMSARMSIWHTPVKTAGVTLPASHAMLASQYSKGLTCEQRLDFSQKTMLRAYTQIKNGAYDPALKTLMVGLEDSGLTCREYKGSLECNPN